MDKAFRKQFAVDVMDRKDAEIKKVEVSIIDRMETIISRYKAGNWSTFDESLLNADLAKLAELKKNRAGADELFQILFDQDEEA